MRLQKIVLPFCYFLSLLLAGGGICQARSPASFAPAKPEAKQIADKVFASLTFSEKIAQLNLLSAGTIVTGPNSSVPTLTLLAQGQVGGLFNVLGEENIAAHERAYNKSALSKKVPLVYGLDVIHGLKIVFPIPLAEAASWNPTLLEDSARLGALEARTFGIQWTFAPMVDISRDPRWGRIAEGAGEDPYLASAVASARVRGFHGGSNARSPGIASCAKHFVGYGAPLGGRDYHSVKLGLREIVEEYLPPFEAAIAAGARCVMVGFHDLDGIPLTAAKSLIQEFLRKRLKFEGIIISDFSSIKELMMHGVAAHPREAAKLALEAGVDMDMHSLFYQQELPALAKADAKIKELVEASARRVIDFKAEHGILEARQLSDRIHIADPDLERDSLLKAREIARESIVLLKNKGDILPLKPDAKIALIGPLADNQQEMIGTWAGYAMYSESWRKVVSFAEGLRRRQAGQGALLVARGANFFSGTTVEDKIGAYWHKLGDDLAAESRLLEEAREKAKAADIIVLALGEPERLSGEAASVVAPELPESQIRLLEAMRAFQKPMVVILGHGRPLVLSRVEPLADAILSTWHLGHEAGNAVADILFGDHSPSGKLPVTFPAAVGQIPIYYSQRLTGRPDTGDSRFVSRYVDAANAPLYAFGHGLSYTKFAYRGLTIKAKKLPWGQDQVVTVKVKNTGQRVGAEVVQLYLRDHVASIAPQVRRLRGFAKVQLRPGEERNLEFKLTPRDLSFVDEKLDWTLEPGEFTVYVGGSSLATLEKSFSLEPQKK